MFKGIANLAGMFRQAQELQGRMKELDEKLRGERVSGNAGGGMVEAVVNGLGEVVQVRIDPSLVERRDREMIEDLIPAAVNQAVSKSQELRMQTLQSLAGGVDFNGLQEAFSKMMGNS